MSEFFIAIKDKIIDVIENRCNGEGWLEYIKGYGTILEERITICQVRRITSWSFQQIFKQSTIHLDYDRNSLHTKASQFKEKGVFYITNKDRNIQMAIHDATLSLSWDGLKIIMQHSDGNEDSIECSIARNKNGDLYIFSDDCGEIYKVRTYWDRTEKGFVGQLDPDSFPSVQWEDDEPKRVKIELIKE